jgi:WAP-type (Whey Acidic Protein) 'four-disulfide core'
VVLAFYAVEERRVVGSPASLRRKTRGLASLVLLGLGSLGLGSLGLGGCFWAGYDKDAPSDTTHDPHAPRSLARSLLNNRRSVAYSDDGERFALHRCKRFRDEREACELALGRREVGIDDIWPVAVESYAFDRGGKRAILDLLADRLDDLDAHGMFAQATGRRAMVDGGYGSRRFVAELDGIRLQLGFSDTASLEDVEPLAAVLLQRGKLQPKVRAVASRRRRDMVAVELWVDVDEPAVAAYNAWVLFFLREDGRWTSRFVRPLRDVLFSSYAELRPTPKPATVVAPAPKPEPIAPRIVPEPEGALKIVPDEPGTAPTSGCQSDADCAGEQRCCSNGIGRRGCHEPVGGGCPKLP